MDELADALGLDPLEFRRRNIKDPRLRAVLDAAAERFGWGRAKAGGGYGHGIAGGFEKGSYIATCAEVAVEKTSGRLRVLRLVAAFECGKVLNPDQLRGQVEGSLIQGLGGALFEAIDFENGQVLTDRFSQYRVPRFSDMPEIEVVLLDRKDLPSAGAGETPIVCVAPAVSNAIFDASGVRLRSLPMAPRDIVKAKSRYTRPVAGERATGRPPAQPWPREPPRARRRFGKSCPRNWHSVERHRQLDPGFAEGAGERAIRRVEARAQRERRGRGEAIGERDAGQGGEGRHRPRHEDVRAMDGDPVGLQQGHQVEARGARDGRACWKASARFTADRWMSSAPCRPRASRARAARWPACRSSRTARTTPASRTPTALTRPLPEPRAVEGLHRVVALRAQPIPALLQQSVDVCPGPEAQHDGTLGRRAHLDRHFVPRGDLELPANLRGDHDLSARADARSSLWP